MTGGDIGLRRRALPALAVLLLAVAACRADTEGAGQTDGGSMSAGLECEAAAGVDPRHLDGLCAALRAQRPADAPDQRLVLLAVSPISMTARLDRTGPDAAHGPELSFDVSDRGLDLRDYDSFAAALLRFSDDNSDR